MYPPNLCKQRSIMSPGTSAEIALVNGSIDSILSADINDQRQSLHHAKKKLSFREPEIEHIRRLSSVTIRPPTLVSHTKPGSLERDYNYCVKTMDGMRVKDAQFETNGGKLNGGTKSKDPNKHKGGLLKHITDGTHYVANAVKERRIRPSSPLSKKKSIKGLSASRNGKVHESANRSDAQIIDNHYVANDGANGSLENLHLESQAMKIVRTVGQAFEVCHKLSHQFSGEGTTGHSPQSKLTNHVMDSSQGDDDYRINESIKANLNKNPKLSVDGSIVPATSCDTMTEEILIQETALPSGDRDNESSPVKIDRNSPRHTKNHNQGFNPVASTNSSPNAVANASINVAQSHSSNCSTESTLTRRHQLQLMKEQLDQQQQQTQAAVVQVHLLRDQLAAEMQARVDVQARNEQLLVQNRQLLEHLQTLVNQLHMLEAKINLNSPQCQNGGGDFSNQHEILSQRSQDSDTSRQNVSQLSSLDLPNIQSLLHNSPIQQQSAAALQQHLLSRQIQTGQSSFSFDPNFQLSQLYGNITSTPLSNIPQSKSLQHFQMPNNTHSQAYLQNGGMGLWSPIRDLSGNSPYQLRTSYNVPVSAKSDFAMPTPKLDPPPPSKNKQSRSPQMIASPETDAPKSSSSNNSLSSIESARQKGGSFNPEQGQIRGGSLKERSANMPSFRQIQLPSILQQTQALMDLNYDFEESSSWNLGDGGGQQSEELSDSEQTRLNRSAWQRHTVGK